MQEDAYIIVILTVLSRKDTTVPKTLLKLTQVDSLKGKDFLSLADLNADEFKGLVDSALELKRAWKAGERPELLKHKSLAMIFEKQSLRTRTTFDVGMFQLGGHSVMLDGNIGFGKRETVKDIAKNLERWVDGIMLRTFAHHNVVQLAEHAHVPVINGLTDFLHPTQLVADYITLKEVFGTWSGLTVVYVGDGNNVCNSHINAAALAGTKLVIACPEGFDPDASVLEVARAKGANIEIQREPREAIKGADVLYTDVWISMGQEEDAKRRKAAFAGYTITPEWFKDLSSRGIFMHDLPTHYGEECVEEAVYHERSRVFDQAENRLHAHKGILYQLLRD
jgi:ornithine carbamoyltransferase